MARMRHVIERVRAALIASARRPLFGHWFGHYAARFYLVGLIAWIVWASVRELATLPGWTDRAIGPVVFGLLMAAPSAMVDHSMRPCDKRVAEMPLDPGLMAERWHRYLSAYHYQRDHRYGWALGSFAYIAVVFAAWWPGPLPMLAAYPLISIPHLLDAAVDSRHAQVRLWCPRCRHGGHGPRERRLRPSPTPVTA